MSVRSSSHSRGKWQSYASRREEAEQAEWRRAAWNMFWLLAIGKLISMIALAFVGYAMLHPAGRNWSNLILLNWSSVLLAIIFVAGPTAYWWRLRRVRRKREALIRAEWNVD